MRVGLRTAAALAGLALAASGAARAATYPARAPMTDYLMADRAAEIALARSAAPAAIGAAARVLVLTPSGYETAAEGSNGFTCIVSRSWFSGVADAEFWNAKIRGPICFNPESSRSVLPVFLERTEWVVSGLGREEIAARTRAEIKSGKIPPPAPGAMTYMLAKGGRLNDDAHGPWHPHIMFYEAPMPTADWGADAPGGPVIGAAAGEDPWTMFFILVDRWSDGTPDARAPA